jgi:hypothetical protein
MINQLDNNWHAKPLNRTGNLSSWKQKMNDACPEPQIGQVVSINSYDSEIGYKVLGFNKYGEVIWQRGEAVKHR